LHFASSFPFIAFSGHDDAAKCDWQAMNDEKSKTIGLFGLGLLCRALYGLIKCNSFAQWPKNAMDEQIWFWVMKWRRHDFSSRNDKNKGKRAYDRARPSV
jgi:hypothetical protein